MTAKDPEFALEYFKQIETLAADILSDRRDIIEYNKKRDKVREASRLVKTALNNINLYFNINL